MLLTRRLKFKMGEEPTHQKGLMDQLCRCVVPYLFNALWLDDMPGLLPLAASFGPLAALFGLQPAANQADLTDLADLPSVPALVHGLHLEWAKRLAARASLKALPSLGHRQVASKASFQECALRLQRLSKLKLRTVDLFSHNHCLLFLMLLFLLLVAMAVGITATSTSKTRFLWFASKTKQDKLEFTEPPFHHAQPLSVL